MSDESVARNPPGHIAIGNLIATYAELVDSGDFAGVGALLAEATFTGSSGTVRGRDAVERMLRENVIVVRGRHAPDEAHRPRTRPSRSTRKRAPRRRVPTSRCCRRCPSSPCSRSRAVVTRTVPSVATANGASSRGACEPTSWATSAGTCAAQAPSGSARFRAGPAGAPRVGPRPRASPPAPVRDRLLGVPVEDQPRDLPSRIRKAPPGASATCPSSSSLPRVRPTNRVVTSTCVAVELAEIDAFEAQALPGSLEGEPSFGHASDARPSLEIGPVPEPELDLRARPVGAREVLALPGVEDRAHELHVPRHAHLPEYRPGTGATAPRPAAAGRIYPHLDVRKPPRRAPRRAPRGPERAPARGRHAWRGAAADPGRRGQRQDSRPGPSDRVPDLHRPGPGRRDPGDHVHQQGGERDARARRTTARTRHAGHVADDLPLGLRAHPARRGGAARLHAPVHDLRPGRFPAPREAQRRCRGRRPEALHAGGGAEPDLRGQEQADRRGRLPRAGSVAVRGDDRRGL